MKEPYYILPTALAAIPCPQALAAIQDTEVLILESTRTISYGLLNTSVLYTTAELNEIEQIKTESRRQEKMAGKLTVKLLACDILKRWFHTESSPSSIEVLSLDSPLRVRAPESPHLDAFLKPLFFSLSHTGGVACAAVGRQPIGVDIEKNRTLSAEMAREIGGDTLLKAMADPSPSVSQSLLPLVVFTQKEAVLKAAGIGMEKGLAAVTLSNFILDSPVEATCGNQKYQVMSACVQDCIITLAQGNTAPSAPADPIRTPGRKKVFPSATQEIMWRMAQVEGMGTTHNVCRALRLHGPLNIEALTRAIQFIINRHEALRTVFYDENGQCRAEVIDSLTVPIPIEIVGKDSSESALEKAKSLSQKEVMQHFDLARPPLIRLNLFVLGKDDHLLLKVFHHTIIDATAFITWRQDLAICYREFSAGRTPVFPPIELTFYDYTRLQRERLTPERTNELLDYWRTTLKDMPDHLTLPTDHPRPAYPTFDSDNVEFTLTPRLIESLRNLRASEGVSLYVTFLAAFQIFLMRMSGQDDVVIGVPFVDRRTSSTLRLMGCLVNMLPLRVGHSEASRFRDLLPRIQKALNAALAHHELPFPLMVEKLAPRRRTSYPPIFQASLLLLREETKGVNLEGLTQELYDLPAGGTSCDLSLYLTLGKTGGLARFEYNRNLFNKTSIRRMASLFLRYLKRIGANPDEILSAFPHLPPDTPLQQSHLSPKGGNGSCILTGEGTLPIRCGEILLQRGFAIQHVVTQDVPLSNWARSHGLPVLPSAKELAIQLPEESFDYLFSIFNVHVLPEPLLQRAAKGAINYHDALLPRYAGLHATSWALLNREPFHGITWHQIGAAIDGGDILIQRRVEIEPGDTALHLNLKCSEAAVESFGELVESLVNGTVTPTRQDLSKRTYFPKYYRPEAACVIRWDRNAEDISALIRALDFGPYHNPLGLPKVATESAFFIASCARILSETFDAIPGTVVRMTQDTLTVSTVTKALEISGLMTVDGRPLTARHCSELFGISIGDRLVPLKAETIAHLTALNDEASRNEEFWAERLGSLQPLPLPKITSSKNVKQSQAHYRHLEWQCPPEVEDWLKRNGKAWRRDEFLLAALGGYWARMTSLDLFDVGFINLAAQAEKTGSEGLFARQIPFRFKVDSSLNFENLLHLTRRELEQVRRRRTYARDMIPRHPHLREQAELRSSFKLSITLIMASSVKTAGEVHEGDLSFIIPEQGTEVGIVFNTEIMDTPSAEKMIRQFTVFMKSVVANDGQPVSAMSILTTEECQLLLGSWHSTSSVCLPEACIHALFEAQVEKNPTGVAMIFEGRELTYQQLNEQANRLAYLLQGLGVGPESRVGVCVERSLDMVVGLLATLKAGGAYVPLDPAYPKERLTFMQQDAQTKVILSQRRLGASLTDQSIPVVYLDALPDQIARESSENPSSGVLPENPAYIIYTSGSTGQPKGVVIEHRSLVNYALAAVQKFAIGPGDRVLQFASINFDASAEEIYPCLISGATLVLRTEEMIQTAATFLALCQAWKITLLDLPTAYWSHLVTQMENENLPLPPLIRLMIIGGESVSSAKVALWQKRVGSRARLFNTYGPTEATIVATWAEITDFDAQPGIPVPIGRPVPNALIYVLDQSLQPVPLGVVGELHIGGTGLARGYLNQPQLTHDRFIPNPFLSTPGARLYKTGDRVRFLVDGNLEFVGRQDHQVKIRGFRVELNEIEAALARHQAIRENIATVREDNPDDKRLVVYFVPIDTKVSPGAQGLREFLKHTLPDHMIPAEFIVLEKFPLDPNGKIDRKSLPAPTKNLITGNDKWVAPRNLTEEVLASIWCEILGLQKIGINENFFDRGGHSLLGVQLITHIRSSFQCELPLRSLFQAPTIAELAVLLKQETTFPADCSHLLEIQKGGGKNPLFFIPGGGGGESEFMVYARMMRQLGHDFPVYGFRIWGLDGKTKPHCSTSAMAKAFIQELRSVQPTGPYSLAGECLGGILTYEIARQLNAHGEKIAFLGMMDTSCPRPLIFMELFIKKIQPRMKQCWDRIFQIPKSQRVKGVPEAIGITLKHLGNDLGYLRSHPRENDAPIIKQNGIKKVGYTYTRTLLRYRPKPYNGKITMLLTDHFKGFSDPPGAWSSFALGGVEIHRLPGDHKTYIRDHAVTTGKVLGACLKEAKTVS